MLISVLRIREIGFFSRVLRVLHLLCLQHLQGLQTDFKNHFIRYMNILIDNFDRTDFCSIEQLKTKKTYLKIESSFVYYIVHTIFKKKNYGMSHYIEHFCLSPSQHKMNSFPQPCK